MRLSFFKKNPIRFEGQKEIETQIKNQTDNVISRRFKILMGFIGVVGVILLVRLFLTHSKNITQQSLINTIQVFLQKIHFVEIFMTVIIKDCLIIKISIVQLIMQSKI